MGGADCSSDSLFLPSATAYPQYPEKYIFYYMLNPVTLVMQMYRKTLLYAESPSAVSLVYILLSACVLLILGAVIFKRLERRFAEEL